MDDPGSTIPIVFNNCISVKAAAFHSGYNMQYLRRLLSDGRLSGIKLGQTWLIDKRTFETHLENVHHTKDKRFGPKRINQFSTMENSSDQGEVLKQFSLE